MKHTLAIRWAALLISCLLAPSLGQAQNVSWKLVRDGNSAFRSGMYQTALSYYEKALSINPHNHGAQFNKGNALMAMHQDSAALKELEKAAVDDQRPLYRAAARHNMGTIYQREASVVTEISRKNNLLLQAIDQYKQALRDNPAMEAARYNMVLCQKQLKDQKDAQQQQQHQPQPQPQPQTQPQKKQEQQPLINYSRQAEQQVRQRLQQRHPQRALRKNW